MATDLESETKPSGAGPVRPSLKITGLHIRNLKSIATLDLPADGLGWSGPMPDMLMIGGINGSGKSTLLNFVATTFEFIEAVVTRGARHKRPASLIPQEGWVDFELPSGSSSELLQVRCVTGDREFLSNFLDLNPGIENPKSGTFTFLDDTGRFSKFGSGLLCRVSDQGQYTYAGMNGRQLLGLGTGIMFSHGGPKIVAFGSENRTLVVHPETHKLPGRISSPEELVQRWSPPNDWKETLEARLYSLRWEDLNDKEEGRPEDAVRFETYSKAFDRFFEGRKRLKWYRGELVVETDSGDIHDLAALSSGEKQVVLFMGELLHRWRPGSLILIDEPELHLHESFQSRLWAALVAWQEERGGQVIVTTQSGHLFGISEPGIKVLLTRGRHR